MEKKEIVEAATDLASEDPKIARFLAEQCIEILEGDSESLKSLIEICVSSLASSFDEKSKKLAEFESKLEKVEAVLRGE